jgi:hypothetical protein
MYIPRNWGFGSALAKLRNFGGGGGWTSQTTPIGTPLVAHWGRCLNILVYSPWRQQWWWLWWWTIMMTAVITTITTIKSGLCTVRRQWVKSALKHFYRPHPIGEEPLVFWLANQTFKPKKYRNIIFPVALYGCETWSLTLWEHRILRVQLYCDVMTVHSAGWRVWRRSSGHPWWSQRSAG